MISQVKKRQATRTSDAHRLVLIIQVHEHLIKELCTSYGAFCRERDQMPLPRLIVLLPAVLCALSLLFELINCFLLCSKWRRVRTILNFCLGWLLDKRFSPKFDSLSLFFALEHMSIALSCAITIHCFWVAAVYLRISLEIPIVHLNWTFFAFALATILTPLDCLCSIYRMVK